MLLTVCDDVKGPLAVQQHKYISRLEPFEQCFADHGCFDTTRIFTGGSKQNNFDGQHDASGGECLDKYQDDSSIFLNSQFVARQH